MDAAPLIPLADAAGPLELVKESWRKGVHDLRAEAGPVGRLDYKTWSGKARAEAADGEWAFSRSKGVLNPTITVTDAAQDREIAVFDRKVWTRGGALEVDGRTYELGAGGIFKPSWTWSHGGADLVVVHQNAFAMGKTKGEIEVTDAGRADPRATLLLLLAVHVILTSDGESGSGAAAAT